MFESILIFEMPKLKDPPMVIGLGGWANAGEVSTGVVAHLLQSVKASKCAELRPEAFFDLSQLRPIVTVIDGIIRSVEYPSNAFYTASLPGSPEHGLVLFMGQEPHLRWPNFIQEFLNFSEHLGVVEIFTIGGLYDNIPHSVEPRVSGLTNHEPIARDFERLGINPANYQGPSSIHSQLLLAAKERQIPATALWGHVPYYIQSHNAKTCHAILSRLSELMRIPVDLSALKKASELLDQQIDRVIKSKPDLQQYIRNLEQDYDPGEPLRRRPARPQPTGDKIIHIDPFLRRDDHPTS